MCVCVCVYVCMCACVLNNKRISNLNPKHTGLFANLIIPGGDKFAQQLYRDNECPDKKNVKQTFLLLVN